MGLHSESVLTLSELTTQVAEQPTYSLVMKLCDETRSASLVIQQDFIFDPLMDLERVKNVRIEIKTAQDKLSEILNDGILLEYQNLHLKGMLENVKHRVKMLEMIEDVSLTPDQRMTKVLKMGDQMKFTQKSFREELSRS